MTVLKTITHSATYIIKPSADSLPVSKETLAEWFESCDDENEASIVRGSSEILLMEWLDMLVEGNDHTWLEKIVSVDDLKGDEDAEVGLYLDATKPYFFARLNGEILTGEYPCNLTLVLLS